jgi:hypothetical protein
MFLNADIPPFYALLRKEYLYDLQAHHGEFVECCVFGIASIPTRAIMFHVMTGNGAQIARLPISAIVHDERAPALALDVLELWNSFSYDVAVTCFGYLRGLRCRTFLRDRSAHDGEYMFTVDWCGTTDSENSGEGGHENAHVLELDNGCFAALPNNRIFWREPAFITRPFADGGARPDYRTNSHVWACEGRSKWTTEDTDRMFYDTVEAGDPARGGEPAATARPAPPEPEKHGSPGGPTLRAPEGVARARAA